MSVWLCWRSSGKQICQNYSSDDLLHAFQFIQDHSLVLVEEFYKNMLLEEEASQYFTDELIQQRLRDTLHQWLSESFSVALNKRYAEAVQKQNIVGHVHARVGIPSWLIMRGVREIQRKMFELLSLNPQPNMLLPVVILYKSWDLPQKLCVVPMRRNQSRIRK
jgi:hypothetical protein